MDIALVVLNLSTFVDPLFDDLKGRLAKLEQFLTDCSKDRHSVPDVFPTICGVNPCGTCDCQYMKGRLFCVDGNYIVLTNVGGKKYFVRLNLGDDFVLPEDKVLKDFSGTAFFCSVIEEKKTWSHAIDYLHGQRHGMFTIWNVDGEKIKAGVMMDGGELGHAKWEKDKMVYCRMYTFSPSGKFFVWGRVKNEHEITFTLGNDFGECTEEIVYRILAYDYKIKKITRIYTSLELCEKGHETFSMSDTYGTDWVVDVYSSDETEIKQFGKRVEIHSTPGGDGRKLVRYDSFGTIVGCQIFHL